MSRLTRSLYKVARAAAWTEAVGKAAGGDPVPLAKRVRNRVLLGFFSRFLR